MAMAMTYHAGLDVSPRETSIRIEELHRLMLAATRADPVCRRLMSVPGVGLLTALPCRTAVEDPGRFRTSSVLGAHFGLTPRKYAFGETDRNGHITRCWDRMVRSLLCQAALVLLTRVQRWSWLKRWGVAVAQRRGALRAQLPLAPPGGDPAPDLGGWPRVLHPPRGAQQVCHGLGQEEGR
jgi:transposase